MKLYMLTASRLADLLQILGALIADYMENPKAPMSRDLKPFVKNVLQWKSLPSLPAAVDTAIKGGDKLSALFELSADIKQAYSSYHQDKDFDTTELNMLKQIRSYLATDSDTALKYICKNAGVFNSPELAKIFLPAAVGSDHKALRRSVKTLVGRDGTFLTADEMALLKDTNAKGLADYQAQRKSHNADYASSLVQYVRSQNKSKVPYQAAFDTLTKQGFTHSMVPGFIGLIDDKGRWYTSKGEAIANIPNLVTYSHVVMNDGKDPDAQWSFKAYKHDGSGVAYGYTATFQALQRKAKSEHVKELALNIDKIRAKWLVKVKKFNIADPDSVAAVVLEILFSYAARIGTAPGRGAGTLLVKNASVTSTGINLAYLGKDSIPTKHIIKSADPIHKYLVKDLTELMSGKTKNDFLYTYDVKSRKLRVTPAMVNKAFHTFGAPSTVTVHKLRTFRGTALFLQLSEADESRRGPATQKDAIQRWKEMTEKVGKLLNHKRGVGTDNEKVTGVTAATSYIALEAQMDLFDRWGFRPPVALEKAAKNEKSDD
jgi:hypothetical protein